MLNLIKRGLCLLLPMSKTQDYKAIISEYIKKQMIILGPVVAVEKARKLNMIKLKEDGNVTQINGDGEEIMTMVESEFEGMIGSVAHTVLLRVIDSRERSSQSSDSRKLEMDTTSEAKGETENV